MRGPGVFSMLQFAAGLSMAGPMFFLGFEFARTGRLVLGVGFFTLGAVVSYAPTFFLRRIGGPRAWIRRRLRRGRGAADGEADDARTDARTDADGVVARFRRLRDRFGR